MIRCPDCGYENIDGEDFCQQCEQPLTSAAAPRPATRLEQRIARDTIRRLAPREPLLVAPETPVGEVLRRMVARRGGCAVVVAAHEVVGIFTERDALRRLNVRAAELAGRPVADFMTRPVETLDHDDRIAFAIHKMDVGGYRHIPILDEGRVAGIISVRHVLDYIAAAAGTSRA
jgi:CBS domain-containing protein